MLRLSDPPAIIEFGHFSILPHRRQLLAEGRPISLGGRAFDVLMALVEASGTGSARTNSRAASGKAGSSIRTAVGH
jgi:DNA-binding response OmpR family regulator